MGNSEDSVIILSSEEIAKGVIETKQSIMLGPPIITEIHDSGNKEVLGISEDDFVLFAQIAIPYQGQIPEDYRVLNGISLDYVKDHFDELETEIYKPLMKFLTDEYSEADFTELLNGITNYIWEDQVDYVPLVDVDSNRIYITIELMLMMEETNPDSQNQEQKV